MLLRLELKLHTYSSNRCVVLVLYVRVGLLVLLLLILLATLLVATVYCLLYVSEYGVLLLTIHIPEQLAALSTCFGHS